MPACKISIISNWSDTRIEQEILKDIASEIEKVEAATDQEYIEALRDSDGIIVMPPKPVFSRKIINNLAKCRVISRGGVGVDNIDLDAAREKGITVTAIPDASVNEVADHTVALALNCIRKIVPLNQGVRSGGAEDIRMLRSGIHRAGALTAGLIGFGRIGKATWKRLAAFNFKGMVYDQSVSRDIISNEGAVSVSLPQLLHGADIVSLHIPLTERTRGFMDRSSFQQMKKGAYLINTARGELVEEDALVEFIQNGHLGGAALDVTSVEPVPKDSRLFELDQVILTGHSAFYSEESMLELREKAALNVAAVLKGKTGANIVSS